MFNTKTRKGTKSLKHLKKSKTTKLTKEDETKPKEKSMAGFMGVFKATKLIKKKVQMRRMRKEEIAKITNIL